VCDTIDKLNETEDKRANTQQVLEETKIEFVEVHRDYQSEIHCLEREIYDQTEAKEFMEKIVWELQKELADLTWYFKPHPLKEEKESRIYGTAEFDLISAKRKAINEDIAAVRDGLAKISIETDWKRFVESPEELAKELNRQLKVQEKKKSEEDADDFKSRITDLYQAMMQSGKLSSTEAFTIVILLTKEDFYPGVLEFLQKIVEKSDDYHFLLQVKSFLTTTYRAWRSSEMADEQEMGEHFEPTTFRRYFKDACVRYIFNERNKNPRYRDTFEATVLAGSGITERDEVELWMRQAIECYIWTGEDPRTKEEIDDILK